MYEESDEQLRMALKNALSTYGFRLPTQMLKSFNTLHASQLYTDTSAKAAMSILFPGNTRVQITNNTNKPTSTKRQNC